MNAPEKFHYFFFIIIIIADYLHISLEMSIFVIDERGITKQCITPEPLAGQKLWNDES